MNTYIKLRQKLVESMNSAFSNADLGRILRYELQKDIASIVPQNVNKIEAIEAVLGEAEKQGWLESLLIGAQSYNDSNAPFNTVAGEIKAGIVAEGKAFYQQPMGIVEPSPSESRGGDVISTGNISNSTGIAIGRNSSVTVNHHRKDD